MNPWEIERRPDGGWRVVNPNEPLEHLRVRGEFRTADAMAAHFVLALQREEDLRRALESLLCVLPVRQIDDARRALYGPQESWRKIEITDPAGEPARLRAADANRRGTPAG